MGAPFATPQDLLAVPEVTLDLAKERDLAIATRAVSKATNAIIAELGWDPRLSERTYVVPHEAWFHHRDRLLPGRSRRAPVILPAQHVTALTAAVSGSQVDPALIEWRESGIVYLYWTSRVDPITITYTAGWANADMPEALKDVCVDWAAGGMYNPRGLREWQVGEAREAYFAAAPAILEPRLDRFRLIPAIA